MFLRVGQLNFNWTNTESLFIHLIAGLADVDKDVAIVIFLTLNTTSARLDLVDRLAKLSRTPQAQRDAILELTTRFRKESSLRNKYNHCIYSFDPEGGQLNTIMMRIADRKNRILVGKQEVADAQEVANIDATIERLKQLNLDIWQTVARFGYPI
ncbi:hypothetical protein [Maritimibacter sp. HL-12]|uniref:hypothetical protein n=1 Tax=Maritimibacter sp. HL-12 TaxID=1162418 RepID=UPI000A0F318B|nr:hypothetical protein [Maritimibacter sp. HL-12]SMH53581.1 hypothetical protein SAMN05661107_2809 [Maritimibacter sp. HL-12]